METTQTPVEAEPLETAPVAPVEAAEKPAEAPEAKAAPKEPEFISDKFAALARKEKSIVKARLELSQQKAEMAKQQEEFKAKMAEFERWQKIKENAKLDPDAYLNEAGITYGYLTERALKGGQDPKAVIEHTNKTLADWEAKRAEEQKIAKQQQEEQAKKDFEERVNNFVKSIHGFVDTNKETYELTALHGQQNLIWEVIQEGARRGQSIEVKDAADRVEQYLTEQVEKSVTGTKKFKEKFSAPKKEEPQVKPAPGTPTLSNNVPVTTSKGPITEQQRMQNALAALNKAIGE